MKDIVKIHNTMTKDPYTHLDEKRKPREEPPDSNEGEELDLGDLNLHSITTSCKQQNLGSILAQWVKLLKESLVHNKIFHETTS
jgi:hypothetical protein